MHRRTFLVAVASGLLVGSARADDDLTDLYNNSASKVPFVSFMARPTPLYVLPGHAIVATGIELDNGLLYYQAIFGFYPKDQSTMNELKALRTSVPGNVTFELADLNWEVQLRVSTTEAKKQAVLSLASTWKNNDPKYNLLANDGKNCNVFAKEVAQAVGLQLPTLDPGATLPLNYIKELKRLNPN